MRVERATVDAVPRLEGSWALTLGTFDGVHRGHASVLGALAASARHEGIAGACAITFDPHPRAFLQGGPGPDLLTTIDERAVLLAAAGVDVLVIVEFDTRVASMPFDDFVRDVLRARLGMVHFVLGHDVHFGRGRGGNAQSVATMAAGEGFSTQEVSSTTFDGAPVSSTRIRQALTDGDFATAVDLLGHPYLFVGDVVRGRGLGRQLGFATANLDLPVGRLRPALGVYAGWARWHGTEWSPAIANVGRGPTVAPDDPPRLEIHVLDRDVDLYGLRVELALAERLRPEKKFESVDALREAIRHDVESVPARLAAVPAAGRPERVDALYESRPSDS